MHILMQQQSREPERWLDLLNNAAPQCGISLLNDALNAIQLSSTKCHHTVTPLYGTVGLNCLGGWLQG